MADKETAKSYIDELDDLELEAGGAFSMPAKEYEKIKRGKKSNPSPNPPSA
jgi:hypothetical protein